MGFAGVDELAGKGKVKRRWFSDAFAVVVVVVICLDEFVTEPEGE
jgi:hypothetical protein